MIFKVNLANQNLIQCFHFCDGNRKSAIFKIDCFFIQIFDSKVFESFDSNDKCQNTSKAHKRFPV